MSLTTIQEPAALSFSKNPVWYRFLSGNYRLTVGDKAKYEIVFSSPLAGHHFTIEFNGKVYTFNCVSSPNGDGYEFRPYGNSTQFNQMVTDFEGNYYLYKHYDFTPSYAGNKIIFEAKENGAIWNMQLIDASTSITLNTVLAGTDDTFNPNYKVFADIHLQSNPANAPETNLIAQLDADAWKDDVVMALGTNEYVFDFELQNILNTKLKAFVPGWNLATVTKATEMLLNFWLRYGEIYGDDPVVHFNSYNGAANNYKQVIIGGLQLDEVTFTVTPSFTGLKLLNRQPATKVISKSCQEYLYKYMTTAEQDLQLQCAIYYTDGTTWSGNVGTAVGLSTAKSVYVFPAGWDVLNLGSKSPTKTPVRYEVYITNDIGTVLSDTQHYVLDLREYEETQRLLFLGACGAMEHVLLTGYTQEKLENEGEQSVAAKMPWYDRGDALLVHANTRQKTIYVFNTGYKSKDYIDWLKELANSDLCLMAEDGYWTSVRIDKGSIKELPTGLDDLYALTFEGERIIHY